MHGRAKPGVLFLLVAFLAGVPPHSGAGPFDPALSPWIRSYSPGLRSSTQTMRIYPHIELNDTECVSCHFVDSRNDDLLPDWAFQAPVNIDDTPYNNLCRYCHNGVEAPFVRTHSSISIDNGYGNWSMECRTCHDPHQPAQLIGYGSDTHLDTGTVVSVSDNAINASGMGWADNVYAGYLVVPNSDDVYHVYKIASNTANSLSVEGPMDLTWVTAGNTFAVIMGKNVKSGITTPSEGSKAVRLFRETGARSYADGDGTYDGVCEVCHTQTTHFRFNGGGSDPLHANVDNAPGSSCKSCHSHENGFGHGGSGSGCGTSTTCHGLLGSHPTHVGGTGMQLALACSACHNASSIPLFSDNLALDNTAACNACHSPGGTYNGVSDLNVGAKNNWTARVYNTDNSLKSGKEKWCASCHDESPSSIGGVTAPNVVGNESGSYPYGTGWGYYKTGHGLPASQAYASKGGLFPPPLVGGATRPMGCESCHEFTARHIDNVARTYGTQGFAQGAYRQGYRLKQVSSQEPLVIPRLASQNNDSSYRLCVQCHYSNVFYDSADTNSNMRNGGTNYHRYHLVYNNNSAWKSDWRSSGNSAVSCPQCHNVHGSTRLAMLNDGSIAGTPPGLVMYYYNTTLSFRDSSDLTAPPIPLGLTLALRDGTTFYGNSVNNIGCTASCHTSANRIDRTYATMAGQVFNAAPTLAWTGETGYTSDGVSPDSGVSGSRFTFRVSYSDNNNNLPSYIRVLLDTDNNGFFEEAYAMVAADNTGGNSYHGKIYTKTLVITNIGSAIVRYKFDAADNAALAATGLPTGEQTLVLLNNSPVLSWTGEPNYESDGVNPNVAGMWTDFNIRVKYTDTEGNCPDGNGVNFWIDGSQYLLDSEGGDCGTGMIYTGTVSYPEEGDHSYWFTATDTAGNPATGDPTSNHTLTVLSSTNIPPVLDWVPEGCRTDGVKPALGLANGDFEFKVKYTDINDQCPASGSSNIQVAIDLDNSGSYEGPGEWINLTEESPGGCTTGKIYKTTRAIPYAGDGVLIYRFTANNGTMDAIGDAAFTDRTLTVVSSATTTGVRPSGGSAPWYSTIQAGVDAAPQNGTVLVYPGTYSGRIWLNTTAPVDTGKTVKSVCGPDMTVTSSGSGSLDSVWLQADGVTIDGFGITGGRYGVFTNVSSASYTIRNCRIYSVGTNYNGIYAQYATNLAVDNTEIYSNTANAPGAGMRVSNATSLVLSNSSIYNNTATSASGDGGGLYVDIVGDVTVSNTVISGNTTARDGGGVGIMTNSDVVFDRVTITGNTAAARGGGISAVSGSTITLNNSLIANNNAGTNGGGIYPALNPVVVNNSTIAFNRAASGGGIYFSDIRTVDEYIRNSILWGNNASGNGQTMYINLAPTSGARLHIYDSIMPDDNDGSYYNYPYFNSPKGIETGGNMSYGDPFFVYADGHDYRIQSVSPAIDQANPATATSYDLDNVARTQGAGPDIGAYEYQAGGGGSAPARQGRIIGGSAVRGRAPITVEEWDRGVLSDTASPVIIYPAP
ncbi:MAG: hypothetical protein HY896_07945 [Deltaproteobacteria bacterium]|nr:hypothetical protein [Deltaproteobacteria bacterium]